MTHEERMKIFSEVETGAVTDAMAQHKVGRWMAGIFPTDPNMTLYGRAFPVQFTLVEPPDKPIDQFKIVSMCPPGDILVWNVPCDGNIIGENIMHFIGNNKVGGVVIDGKTRDYAMICKMGVPEFTRGLAIKPAPRNMRALPSTINVSIECGGVTVNPGDYIFGDADGVLVVPEESIDLVLRQARLNMEFEKLMEETLNNNATVEQIAEAYKTKRVLKD